VKRQLAALDAKLNKILDLINPPVGKVKAVVATSVPTEPKKERKPKTGETAISVTKKVAKKAVKKTVKKAKK
jgi:hypothetical protein